MVAQLRRGCGEPTWCAPFGSEAAQAAEAARGGPGFSPRGSELAVECSSTGFAGAAEGDKFRFYSS